MLLRFQVHIGFIRHKYTRCQTLNTYMYIGHCQPIVAKLLYGIGLYYIASTERAPVKLNEVLLFLPLNNVTMPFGEFLKENKLHLLIYSFTALA